MVATLKGTDLCRTLYWKMREGFMCVICSSSFAQILQHKRGTINVDQGTSSNTLLESPRARKHPQSFALFSSLTPESIQRDVPNQMELPQGSTSSVDLEEVGHYSLTFPPPLIVPPPILPSTKPWGSFPRILAF